MGTRGRTELGSGRALRPGGERRKSAVSALSVHLTEFQGPSSVVRENMIGQF